MKNGLVTQTSILPGNIRLFTKKAYSKTVGRYKLCLIQLV